MTFIAEIRRRRTFLAGAMLFLAACDQAAGSGECAQLARDLEDAAKCVAKATQNGAVAEACPGDSAKLHAAGFTSLDATKIAATNIKTFYSTYYGKDFCAHFFPKWLSRKLD